MLAQGTLEHDARVRKSAQTLSDAGFDVHVLGARWKGDSYSPSEPPRDFELKVVRVLPRRLVKQRHRAAARTARADARHQRVREQAHAIARDQGREFGRWTGLRHALLERRRRLARASVRRAQRREKQLIARTKTPRTLEDPLYLAAYEAAWWPHIRRLRPDVIHVHSWHGLSAARRAARQGVGWIFDVHDHPTDGVSGKQAMQEAAMRQVAEHALQADVVITVSETLADRLVTDLGLPRRPAVVYNTPLRSRSSAPRPGLRDTAGVPPGEPLLVYSGTLSRMRRLDVVLAALELLPEVRLALVVNLADWRTETLLEQARTLGVDDRVHAVPWVAIEAVVPYIAEADIGVWPIASETAGALPLANKLFEYLHAGLPMVVSDASATAAFVRRYGLGAVAALDDVPAWADAIRRTLAAPPYREERPKEWEQLKDEWSWEHQGEILVGIYGEVLSSRRR
jgi:glycosyltransferase involved in cell wall biosynthesis